MPTYPTQKQQCLAVATRCWSECHCAQNGVLCPDLDTNTRQTWAMGFGSWYWWSYIHVRRGKKFKVLFRPPLKVKRSWRGLSNTSFVEFSGTSRLRRLIRDRLNSSCVWAGDLAAELVARAYSSHEITEFKTELSIWGDQMQAFSLTHLLSFISTCTRNCVNFI